MPARPTSVFPRTHCTSDPTCATPLAATTEPTTIWSSTMDSAAVPCPMVSRPSPSGSSAASLEKHTSCRAKSERPRRNAGSRVFFLPLLPAADPAEEGWHTLGSSMRADDEGSAWWKASR